MLRKLSSEEVVLSLDQNILIRTLFQSLSTIIRNGQSGGVPMTAEIHMVFEILKMGVLGISLDLQVFDVPVIVYTALQDGITKRSRPRGLSDAYRALQDPRDEVLPACVGPVDTRTLFLPRPCCSTHAAPQLGAASGGLRLTEAGIDFLAAISLPIPPIMDVKVQEKLSEA